MVRRKVRCHKRAVDFSRGRGDQNLARVTVSISTRRKAQRGGPAFLCWRRYGPPEAPSMGTVLHPRRCPCRCQNLAMPHPCRWPSRLLRVRGRPRYALKAPASSLTATLHRAWRTEHRASDSVCPCAVEDSPDSATVWFGDTCRACSHGLRDVALVGRSLIPVGHDQMMV